MRYPYIILPRIDDQIELLEALYPVYTSAFVPVGSSLVDTTADWRRRFGPESRPLILIHRIDQHIYCYQSQQITLPNYTLMNSIPHFAAYAHQLKGMS